MDSTAAGRVEWIGVRPGRRQPVTAKEQVMAIEQQGLQEDHKAARAGGRRQVTLIQQEHFSAIEALVGSVPDPARLRRNLVVSGINLQALIGKRFKAGEAVLEGSGGCPPCRNMDTALGPGGCMAMTGMGGITARILDGGTIRVGDAVVFYNAPTKRRDTARLI